MPPLKPDSLSSENHAPKTTLFNSKVFSNNPTSKKPKIIISGVGGFVGAYAAKYFLSQNFDVFGFDRHGSTISHPTTRVIDLLDQMAVEKFIEEVKPTHFLHLAAQSSVKKSWDEPQQTHNINVQGTKNILDSIHLHTPQCIILIISSAEIYGIPQKIPITETTPLNPSNPYATSRLKQEELCKTYHHQHHLKIIIARSFPHTGPGQIDQFVCSNFAKQIALIEAKQQPPILSVGNLEAKRDFTDVRDIVKAYHLLITHQHIITSTSENHLPIYNVCSGISLAISDILTQLLNFSNIKIIIEQDSNKIRPSDIPNLLGDNTKLVQSIGWKPLIPIEQTLQEILNYWRTQIKL